MTQFDRHYLIAGLLYGILGMLLGIYMASSQNHGQSVTHAHLLLVGFLLSMLYAIVHRLWLAEPRRVLALLQFGAHHAGVFGMVAGLFLLYGGFVQPTVLEPVLAVSSLAVLAALILMLVMVLVESRQPASAGVGSPA